MGIISRLLLGDTYSDGYGCGKEWSKQAGSEASDNTILNVWEDVETGNPAEFAEGWRDAEDDQRGFFSWLLGK